MTIALIRIPHKLPARLLWFGSRSDLFEAAIAYAFEEGHDQPDDFNLAISSVTEDCHSHIIVESAADVHHVRNYEGHQKQRVRDMVQELEDEFLPQESNSHESN